ncbi:MAG: helix-turn-helix transcriptional regulator, partial [Planctomycetaceae bacterium]|nr:helix-turn-helix transcriptional regulator [Planctomycetaceae bacterium]
MARRLDQQIPVDKDRLVEIYLTAAQIFHQQGFDATSMSDIAEGVNLTKAGLYYYISSKEELLNAIMDYAMTLLQDRVVTPSTNIEDPQE